VTPLELPTKDDQNKMRSVLGLDSDETTTTSTHTSFASLLDNGLVASKPMTLAEKLLKTRE
jgi:hypothetical protein